MVHHIALPLQKNMNAPIAKPPAFMGNLLHPLPKIAIVGARGLVSNRHAAAADGFISPPLGSGPPPFFPNKSFRATLSSMASASSRFSRVFSSSSVFSRLASETSMPPYFAFHF